MRRFAPNLAAFAWGFLAAAATHADLWPTVLLIVFGAPVVAELTRRAFEA